MKILKVRRIAFHGKTEDSRSPEDFAFPAAMTSMMEYLGENVGIQIIQAHDTDWLHRSANDAFVAASGIGFALLWDEKLCPSAMDLLQAAPYDKGIENAFRWAGWTCERVSGEKMKEAAVRAIDEGKPLIALGLTNVPEAALICGYDEQGETLFGWSHFQGGMETIENGMFAAKGWTQRTWEIIVPKARAGRTLELNELLREGVRIMEQTAVEGYAAGQAAYERWIAAIENCAEHEKEIYEYHHAVLFNMAEARCWCGEFLKEQDVASGVHFKRIHDLCWKADAAVRSAGELKDEEKRAALISVLKEIRAEEKAALEAIREYIG